VTYQTPEYQFFIRNLRTLAYVDEINPADVEAASWKRMFRGGGAWVMTLPLDDRYTATLLATHQLIHVVRNGATEFIGVIMLRKVNALGKKWVIGGPDLTSYWLSQRIVGETTADDVDGIGETVAKAYVEAYLGPSAAAARRGTAYLSGKTFTVAADDARGSYVYSPANRMGLLAVTQSVCEAAELCQEVTMTADGYEYDVTEIADHTSAAGEIPFSVAWDNVEGLEFSEDYTNHRNYHFVAGDGSGGARNVTEVEDTASISAGDMRWEQVIDAPFATTVDQRATVGGLEILRRRRSIVTVKAKPFRASQNSVYREDFNVGWKVTFAEPRLRAEAIDLPIAAVSVAISHSGQNPVEDVSFDLGVANPDSIMRRYQEAIAAMQASLAAR